MLKESREPLTPPFGDAARRRSSPILPTSPSFPSLNVAVATPKPFIISPPPTPRSPRPRAGNLSRRLRSNSGLSFHTNQEALRQYTDYNPDGSPKTPSFAPVLWQSDTMNSIDSMTAGYRNSMGMNGNASTPSLPIPDFFGRDVFQMVLSNPTTAHRLLKFAQSRGSGESMEYLLKVSPCP
jgi:phototropin